MIPCHTAIPPQLRAVAVPFLIAVISFSAPIEAQVRVGAVADAVCAAPPMMQDSLDRLKRRPDYMGLMDRLSNSCPQVAMLFMDFSVGSIDGQGATRRSYSQEFIGPLDWPAPSDRNF